MSDELLAYYEKELAFIRQMGAGFAEEHPKIAGRLGINSDTIEDPHVSRLIESFAYLNARIQHKLDDDFPELSDAMLSVLFPHYQRPIPSMTIVQFMPDESQLDSQFHIKTKTLLETAQYQGENCQFNTVYPVDMHPFKVSEATLLGRPFTTPGANRAKGAGGVLKLTLKTFNTDITFSDLKTQKIRFYLKGQAQHINPLYQLLLRDCHNVMLAKSDADTAPVSLGKHAIKAVGFNEDDSLLPYPEASFIGYRLLTEYFVYPEKFMFIELNGLADKIPEDAKDELHLYIYVDSTDVELEHNISADTFMLGCTPAINLFEHRTDPIKLDHTQTEYQITPDSRRPTGYEVHSIETVTATDSSGKKYNYEAFYGLKHDQQEEKNVAYWYGSRRHAKLNNDERDEGTDVFISLVDLNFNPNITEGYTLSIDTLCSNRDQPAKLPFNMEQPRLQCVNGAPPCSRIRCLTQPSNSVRPPLRNFARWRLISHLNLNHLSLTGGSDATNALKEILHLYDFKESSVTRGLIDSIINVKTRSITAPLTIDNQAMICRGIEVEVELDGQLLTGSSAYLFANVLEAFFALYCSINSFTRVLVKLRNQEGYLKKCPPRAGEKIIL